MAGNDVGTIYDLCIAKSGVTRLFRLIILIIPSSEKTYLAHLHPRFRCQSGWNAVVDSSVPATVHRATSHPPAPNSAGGT